MKLQEDERLWQHELRERELETQEAERLKQHELARVLDKCKAIETRKMRNAENEKRKAKERLERDRKEQPEREYELQAHLQEQQHARDMEKIEPQRLARPVPAPRDKIRARTPKKFTFSEDKDEMEYLLRFERYATAQGWDKGTWATDLDVLLQGKTLDVYALMPKEDALDYDKLKCALLKRYELTEECFKRKYKKCRPESGETFQQFTTRMKSYCTRWIDMSGIEKTFENLQDLILRDQLTFICNRDLKIILT